MPRRVGSGKFCLTVHRYVDLVAGRRSASSVQYGVCILVKTAVQDRYTPDNARVMQG